MKIVRHLFDCVFPLFFAEWFI